MGSKGVYLSWEGGNFLNIYDHFCRWNVLITNWSRDRIAKNDLSIFEYCEKHNVRIRIRKFPDLNIAKNCLFTFFCAQSQFVLFLISKTT